MKRRPFSYAQRGNILFLILLAIVLFAALSYAVTSSVNGGTKDVSNEKAATTAAQIINMIGLQEPELMRFMERKNLKIHQIDFMGTLGTADSSGNSPNCNSTDCDFWSGNGGGVTAPILPATAADPATLGSYCAYGGNMYRMDDDRLRPFMMVISATGVGTQASDLVLFYHCISPKVCAEINIQEGVRMKQEAIIIGNSYGSEPANRSKLSSNSATGLIDTSADRTAGSETRLMSRRLWCRELTGATASELYAVIYAR